MGVLLRFVWAVLLIAVVGGGWVCAGQTAERGPRAAAGSDGVDSGDQPRGQVCGTVMDQSGALVAGARVKLTSGGQAQGLEIATGADGQFCLANVTAGSFELSVSAAGFETQVISGNLAAGEMQTVPPVALSVANTRTEVQVGVSRVEVAEEEIKVEETQRVLGMIPNFYVSYVPNAAPLTPGQKFRLAFRTLIDPFTFVFTAGAAGVEQAQNHFAGYGQGAEGYAKRFGASYGDSTTATLIGGAILPSVLKQDPRYFYKGTGSKSSRALYAIEMAFVCKGDNGRWQFNYSNILGSLASGGISNLYYPAQDRNGAALTLENAALGIGATAIANLMQEFVIRKLTPKAPPIAAQH